MTSEQPIHQPSSPAPVSSNTTLTTSGQSVTPLPSATPPALLSVNNNSTNQTTLPSSSTINGGPSQTIQNLLADRRRKLEIDKKEKDAAKTKEREAKANARQEALVTDPDSAKAKQAACAQEQRKRQQEARLERERILRQIEHDKSERKEKDSLRKRLAKAQAEGNDGAGGLVDQQLTREVRCGSRTSNIGECAIQIRLFDGSTIRSKFSLDKTLRTDVRFWVDKERLDGDSPYTFKQILTPMPNRVLSVSEEEKSLQSLGLAPSANLVTVPVEVYTAAYPGSQDIVARGAATGYNLMSAGAGLVSGALGTFLGLGQATVQSEVLTHHPDMRSAATDRDPRGAASDISIRTLHDQRENQDDHQLYNGNQVSHACQQGNEKSRLTFAAECRASKKMRRK